MASKDSDSSFIDEVDNSPLNEDDLFDLNEALADVTSKWKAIGIAFRLKPGKLETIKEKCSGNSSDCLCDVLIDWINRNYNTEKFGEPTWQRVVEVVAHPAAGGNKSLAASIAKKHPKKRAMAIDCANPENAFLEANLANLKSQLATLQKIGDKDQKQVEESLSILINKQVGDFVTTCLQTGCNPEDIRDVLTNLHSKELLISSDVLKLAMEKVESVVASNIPESNGGNSTYDSVSKEEEKILYCEEVVYHATLCSYAVSTCDSSNFKDFFIKEHPNHCLDEASISISRGRNNIERYLIAKQGKTYFIAFKSETLLSEWLKNFTSFDKGFEIQANRIPLRFLVKQLHDGCQIVLSGFSYGGHLAVSIAASLWQLPNLLSSDLLKKNVCCITFGQPLLNLPLVQKAIDESPELASTIHSFYLKDDIFPQLNLFLDPQYEEICRDVLWNVVSDFRSDFESSTSFQGLSTSHFVHQLSYLQDVDSQVELSATKQQILDSLKAKFKAILPHMLADGSMKHQLQPENVYLIESDTKKGLVSKSLTREEALTQLKYLTIPLIDSIDIQLFQKHSVSEYSRKILKILKIDYKNTCELLADLKVAKPRVESVSFHRHGKEIAVTITGDNLWFCNEVKVNQHREQIYARSVSQRSIQFNFDPEINHKLSSDEDIVNVSLWTHFCSPVKGKVNTNHKVYTFTFRQEQLAKLNPSELIETAYMSALLEQHPHSQSKGAKCLSKRFETLRRFLEQAVSVVPVESLLFTIAHSKDMNISLQCCRHLMELPIQLPPSLLSNNALVQAREILSNIPDDFLQLTNSVPETGFIDVGNITKEVRKRVKKMYNKSKKLRGISPVHKVQMREYFYMSSLPYLNESQLELSFDHYYGDCSNKEEVKYLYKQLIHMLQQMKGNPSCNAISSINLSSIYSLQSESDDTSMLKPPLNILTNSRKKLSWLAKQTLLVPTSEGSSEAPVKLSQLYNSRMLEIVNMFRSNEVKVSSLLLGAFMEDQIKVPLMKTSLDTARALNVAFSAAAVGVWAMFSLALGDLKAIIDSIPSRSLLIEVTDYIKGIFKQEESIADESYAGKLQFMVQGMKETVSYNSHYVSYSLERQLIELCKKLNIDKSTPLETLINNWDEIFKSDVLCLVVPAYRSLIARWLKWALMVHHLREELACYTAVGVVGLVNSGKSLLVKTLFDIEVPVGTTAIKRTTVPFLYNLDGVIDGLDVIDFPGVDDRDETIPELAELLLAIAQVVVFVVDYRKAHTESAKKWLELLEDKSVPVLVCLTYADKLYAEHMGKDGSHPDPDFIKQEIGKETEMVKEQLGQVPSHEVQFFSFSQDRDSVLNTPEGREKLQHAGIGTPQGVGAWLAKIFKSQLDQDELAKTLLEFVCR